MNSKKHHPFFLNSPFLDYNKIWECKRRPSCDIYDLSCSSGADCGARKRRMRRGWRRTHLFAHLRMNTVLQFFFSYKRTCLDKDCILELPHNFVSHNGRRTWVVFVPLDLTKLSNTGQSQTRSHTLKRHAPTWYPKIEWWSAY